MELPVPAAAPVTLGGSLNVQLKVVAATLDESEILVWVEGQIVSTAGVAVITGSGFTVTT